MQCLSTALGRALVASVSYSLLQVAASPTEYAYSAAVSTVLQAPLVMPMPTPNHFHPGDPLRFGSFGGRVL